MEFLAHVTPAEVPWGLLLFVAGFMAGTLVTLAIWNFRSR